MMAADLGKRDITILNTILNYMILTISQLALLCFPSRQMARKKVRELAMKNLLEVLPGSFSKSSGRPENIVTLNSSSQNTLKKLGHIGDGFSNTRVTSNNVHGFEHQLLINWVRIFLNQMERQLSRIRIEYLSSVGKRQSYEMDIDIPGPGERIIPDGVFSIIDHKSKKALLFFLEVDMGTETLFSKDSKKSTIHQKIMAYQHIFRNGLYKTFEDQFVTSFKGFRVLFVVNTDTRLKQLCRLIASMNSTDFIWLADQDSIFKLRISDRIWIRGGRTDLGLHSILGPSLAFGSPNTLD